MTVWLISGTVSFGERYLSGCPLFSGIEYNKIFNFFFSVAGLLIYIVVEIFSKVYTNNVDDLFKCFKCASFKSVFIAIAFVFIGCFYIAMSNSLTIIHNIPVGFLVLNTTAVLIQMMYVIKEYEFTFPLIHRLLCKIFLCRSTNVVLPILDPQIEMQEDDGGIFTG